MRDYALWVPEDTVAAECDARAQSALKIMREAMNAETGSSNGLNLGTWIGHLDEGSEEAEQG